MVWHRRQPAATSGPSDPALECTEDADALLEGRLLEVWNRRGLELPGWVWINSVAHGDLERLEHLAQAPLLGAGDALARSPAWAIARVLICGDTLEVADGSAEVLEHLQREVLIPLELRLMDDREPAFVSVLDLVHATRDSLLRSTE